jgi:hypothetical protein
MAEGRKRVEAGGRWICTNWISKGHRDRDRDLIALGEYVSRGSACERHDSRPSAREVSSTSSSLYGGGDERGQVRVHCVGALRLVQRVHAPEPKLVEIVCTQSINEPSHSTDVIDSFLARHLVRQNPTSSGRLADGARDKTYALDAWGEVDALCGPPLTGLIEDA